MYTVLGFYEGDKEQTIKLAEWIVELGGVSNHDLLLVIPPGTSIGGVIEPMKEAFRSVEVITTLFGRMGWPQGPNEMFDCAGRYVENVVKRPFFWIEPDCTPITPDWIDKLELEYYNSKKLFLGNFVLTPDKRSLMNGVGIYTHELSRYCPRVYNCVDVPWDYIAGPQIVPLMHRTNLIQHEWRCPSFKQSEKELKNRLKPETVMFHGVKDDSLIKLLRKVKL